jgi:hypothetical protein
MNLEVVLPHPDDGGDMAVATPDDYIEATKEAISMAKYGGMPFLRIDGVVTNHWLNNAWVPQLST